MTGYVTITHRLRDKRNQSSQPVTFSVALSALRAGDQEC